MGSFLERGGMLQVTNFFDVPSQRRRRKRVAAVTHTFCDVVWSHSAYSGDCTVVAQH